MVYRDFYDKQTEILQQSSISDKMQYNVYLCHITNSPKILTLQNKYLYYGIALHFQELLTHKVSNSDNRLNLQKKRFSEKTKNDFLKLSKKM